MTQSVPVGSNITWRYEESTSSATFTGTPTATGSASSDVSCNITTSASQTLSSSCTGASKTSTLAISNSGSSQATAYFLIEYSVDGGSNWVQKEASKSVTVGGSDTVTQTVNNGTAIQWRYKTSTVSGSFSGDYVTGASLNSATVDCPTPAVTASHGTCSGGGAPINVLLDNTGQGAGNYFKVQYSIDNSTWTDGIGGSHVLVGADSTSTVSLSGSSFTNDTTVYIRYQTSSSTDFSSASTTNLSSIEIDCPILNATATASAASCSSGSAAIPITLINTNSTAAGTFTVSYSTDGGSNFTVLTATTVGAGATDSSSLSVPALSHDTSVIIKYSVANSSEGLSQSEVTLSTITINCPVIAPAVSHETNGCKNNGTGQGGTMGKIKITVDNSGSNVAITFLVQKRATNAVTGNVGDWMYFGGSTTGEDSGKSINAGATQEFAVNTAIANGTGREHRYSTDGGATWTAIGSALTISCASVSTSLGSCSDSQTQTPSITLSSGSDSTVSVFYRVEYSTDGGSNWTQLKSDEEVTAKSSETYFAPALANGESIQWRYSSRKSGGSHDSSSWVTDDTDIPGVDPTLSYTASCTVTTTTTTTTTTSTSTTTTLPTTTTTIFEPIFKPDIINNGRCSADGSASFGLSAINSQSNVGMTIRLKIFVNKTKMVDNTYSIAPRGSLYISTLSGVPEGSTYRIRVIVRDTLSGQKSKGGFKKIIDCIEEPDITSTTTTLLGIDFTDEGDTTSTTTTTIPEEDQFCEGLIHEEGDDCEGPLTEDEGNDFFEWDEFDEDIYLTDGNYNVQYFYSEDSLQLAATGINLKNIVISSVLLFLSGLFFFTKSRKRKLLSIVRTVDSNDLDAVYKNVFKLKKQIEKTFKEEVNININLDLINPYGVLQNQVSERINNINNLSAELNYTKVAVSNLVKKYQDLDEELTKDVMLERISLISSGLFEICFTGKAATTPLEERYVRVKKLSKTKLKKQKISSAKFSRLSLGFSSLLILTGMGLGIYAMQQVYLTDLQYQTSQRLLEQMYAAEDNEIKIEKEENQNLNERVLSVFNDVPVFESLRDTFIDKDLDNSIPYSPTVFGQLQIDSINLNQYVVSGTNEKNLEFGPGHYLQTSLPGNGGNVGIAGHRTTFGAPFAKLDQVEIGDQVILTVNNKKFHYTIDEVSVVEASGGEYVLYNRGDDRITLTTCHPKYSARQRLVVTGILTKIESAN